jgi:uncharacterized protein (UPF0332 family)
MKVDLKKLMNKAERTLRSAEILYKDGDDGGAVSRAYYAMFYCAEAALQSLTLKFSSHRSVISMFSQHFILTKKFDVSLGRHLNRAFERRMKGDYEHDILITREHAEETLEWARQFVAEVNGYLEKVDKTPPGGGD